MHLVHWGLRAARVKPITLEKRWERAARRYEGSGSTRLGDFFRLGLAEEAFVDIIVGHPVDIQDLPCRNLVPRADGPDADALAAHIGQPF